MPDLIIKPTATSGNKLILKDQAGGAVLTTADSGATIANATLTTPTIASMANCTFPAGHVIKTSKYSSENQVNVTSTGFNTSDVIGNFQFTPLKASSNLLIYADFIVYANETANYIYVDLYKNASDVTETTNLSGASKGIQLHRWNANWHSTSFLYLDTCAENSLSEKTYKISGRTESSGNAYIGWGEGNGCPLTFIIHEIAT